MHRVVVVGAGFGGLSAARALIGKQVEVTVVDQRNFHTFQPLLYEVATAGLESGDVAYPIRVIFGKADNVTFRMAAVTGVDWERREVLLADAAPLPFDSLIVASGATAKFFGIPGASEHSFPLYTLTDARRLRDHILRRLEDVDALSEARRRRGALTFVVVGGGPTGVEVAGALAELLDVAVRHDGFRFERSAGRIILVDALYRLLTPFRGRRPTTRPAPWIERQSDEVAQIARAQPVPGADGFPFRLARTDLAVERERHMPARPHAERLGDGGPDVFPDEHVAIGDVEDLVAGVCRLTGPGDDAGQQVGVDGLGHARRAAGEGQVQPGLAPQGGIDTKGGDHVHGAAGGIADDQDRAQDRPGPVLAPLQGAQVVFLIPVEVRLLVHFRAIFPRRHRKRADMDAIGLGAL